MQNLNLSQQQKDNLVAFLRTLTGSAVYSDPRWSDPFDAQGQLKLIILPNEAVTLANRGDGTALLLVPAGRPDSSIRCVHRVIS